MKQEELSRMDFMRQLVYDVFFISFFMYSVSFFLESLYKGSVVNFFNLNSILIICIGSGIFSVLLPPKKKVSSGKKWIIFWIGLLGVAAGLAIYKLLPDLWRWRAAYAGAMAVMFASVLYILAFVSDAIHSDS